jgi:hypothetical protein
MKFRPPRWLVLGIAVRLVIAPWVGHPFDIKTFMVVGAAVAHGVTPYGLYKAWEYFPGMNSYLAGNQIQLTHGIGYPPLWGVILAGLYDVAYRTTHNLFVYNFALKLPAIIGDILSAALLTKVVGHLFYDLHNANVAAKSWFLNPFLILAGTVWGMFDVLVVLFAVLSIYLLSKEKWALSAIALGISMEFKPIPIVLLPLFGIFVWRRSNLPKAIIWLFMSVLTFAALTFSLLWGFGWAVTNLASSEVYQISPPTGAASLYTGWIAFNFILHGSEPSFVPLFLSLLWIPVTLLFSLIYYLKGGTDFRSLLFWSLVIISVSYAFRTFVNETQFVIPLYMLLLIFCTNNRTIPRIYWALSSIMALFIIIHPPIIQFVWLLYPQAVQTATLLTTSRIWGSLRWISSAALIYAYTFLMARELWKISRRLVP